MKIFFALALLAPLSSHAATATCAVHGTKEGSQLASFIDGKILIDLTSGNTTLMKADARRELITNEAVSTFSTPRSGCNMASEKIIRPDGSLRAIIFRFANCVNREPLGYVRAEVEFDLTANFGAYREILLTPRGEPPSDFVSLGDCSIEP